MSLAVNSSVLGSAFLIFLERPTKPEVKTGAEPNPLRRNPVIIKTIFLGRGGHGYKNKGNNVAKTKPKLITV